MPGWFSSAARVWVCRGASSFRHGLVCRNAPVTGWLSAEEATDTEEDVARQGRPDPRCSRQRKQRCPYICGHHRVPIEVTRRSFHVRGSAGSVTKVSDTESVFVRVTTV